MAETSQQTGEISSYRWAVMGLWTFAGVSGFMVLSAVGILLPSISSELRLSPGEQGILGSSAFWGNIVLAIPLSWWMSRYGAKTLTTVTLALGTLFLLLQGWAPVFGVLLAGRLAFGISIIARQPARALLTRQWFPPREVVIVNSASNALFGLVVGGGQVATPLILASLGDNWRGVIYAFGGLFAALTVLWMLFGKERAAAPYQRRESFGDANALKGALMHRDLWIAGLGFVGVTAVWSGFLNFFPTLMLERYDVSLSWSGAILAVAIFVGGMAGLGFGYLAMKTGQEKAILLALGLLMAGTYVGMTLTPSIPLLFLFSFLNGIAWGFWPILFTVPFHLPGMRSRELAVAVSVTMMMSSVGIALGPLVTGYLQQALGDLQTSLFIVSFGSLSLSAAGLVLRFGTGASSIPVS